MHWPTTNRWKSWESVESLTLTVFLWRGCKNSRNYYGIHRLQITPTSPITCFTQSAGILLGVGMKWLMTYISITSWLGSRYTRTAGSNIAAKINVRSCFPDLNMTPLFQWGLKFLPLTKAWFQCDVEPATIIRSRELSAIYSFVRGMPVWVADDCKQYLAEQLNGLDAIYETQRYRKRSRYWRSKASSCRRIAWRAET